jgi:hypothetical protein
MFLNCGGNTYKLKFCEGIRGPGTSSDIEILAGTAPPITLSSDSLAAWLSEDDPNWHAFHDVPIRELVDEESEEEDFPELPPPPKCTKKNYNLTRRFQME